MQLQFEDLDKLARHRFRRDNHFTAEGIDQHPAWLKNGGYRVEPDYCLVGYCRDLPQELVRNEGHCGLLLWHPDDGNVWQHLTLSHDRQFETVAFETWGEVVQRVLA